LGRYKLKKSFGFQAHFIRVIKFKTPIKKTTHPGGFSLCRFKYVSSLCYHANSRVAALTGSSPCAAGGRFSKGLSRKKPGECRRAPSKAGDLGF